MKSITNEWLVSASSDIAVIECLIDRPDLTHQVSFHAQQAVEKSFKALIEEFELGFVKTHSLELLYDKVGDVLKADVDKDQLIILDQLYIDARYPGVLGLLPDGHPSLVEARLFSELARMVYESCRKVCGGSAYPPKP